MQRIDRVSVILNAITGLLGHVSNVLRQLVYVACWLALLIGSVGLLLHPVFTPEHLAIPGIGALGAAGTLIRPRKGTTGNATSSCELDTTEDKP